MPDMPANNLNLKHEVMLLHDPQYKPIIGKCKSCQGQVRRYWRSRLGYTQYACDSCGRVTSVFDGSKHYDPSTLQSTFNTVYSELVKSGISYPRAIIVCQIVMYKLHITEFQIKSLYNWGYTTDTKGRLHYNDKRNTSTTTNSR